MAEAIRFAGAPKNWARETSILDISILIPSRLCEYASDATIDSISGAKERIAINLASLTILTRINAALECS